MLRANADFGNLRLLLPMVSTVAEVHEARHVLARAIESLSRDGITVEPPPLGVMIEVPGAIYALDTLATCAEFFALGTNDLTQYLMAVDRGNPRVATLYDHLHPAVLRAVRDAMSRAHDVGKPMSLCGELAGDPGGALLLIAMGVDHLSVSASALPRTKWVIRSVSHARAAELLEEALHVPDARSVRQLVHHALEKAGLGGLLRAGR
jgi:phosphotransferase system enzyme I (PtsP)